MVAPVESILSELETGADTHQHLLYKKFKYTPKAIAPKSREEIAVMDTSNDNQPTAIAPNPPEDETSADGRRSALRSPALGTRASISPDVLRGGLSATTTSPPHLSGDKPAYMIRWNRFEEQVCNAFAELFCSDHFVDVTLACEGEMMKAHKIVLAMSSPFFRRIFQETPCKHPVVIIKGMTPKTLRSVLQYIYLGEVTLNKAEINSFMDAADYLSICGVFANLYSCDISTTAVRTEGRTQEEDENEMDQDYDKPSSAEGCHDQDPRTASESETGGPVAFRDDSQSEQEEGSSQTHSNVIKYHGIKSRWSRRYSNTSYQSNPTEPDHQRSASAGEMEEASGEQGAESGPVVEGENLKAPAASEETTGSKRQMEVATPTAEDEATDERACVSDDPELAKEHRFIHRGYPKYYLSNYEENSGDVTRNEPPYAPSAHSSFSRPSRGLPYAIGAKDFSHPLQVSVDTHAPQPPIYSGSSSSTATSTSAKVVESSGRLKSHSGFTVYASPQSMPSQRTMFRTQSESEFPITSSPMSLLSHHREDRSVVKTPPQIPYHRQQHPQHHSQPSHHPQNPPPPPHQYHSSSEQSHHHTRPHLPLLSTQSPWSIPEHQRSRGPTISIDESIREADEFRFRSHSMDREFPSFGGAKQFFSHANQLRGVPGFASKSHSYPTATDLSVSSLSQQYSLGFMPQLKSPPSSSTSTRPKTKAIRSSQVPQSARYTAAEVDQMVDAVANYPGNIVPCTLCQKFVKRERLRAHIHECHLLSGEKIQCNMCGIYLKSKGSFRVHIWRHKRGALPSRNTMTDFGQQDRPPSPHAGPASH